MTQAARASALWILIFTAAGFGFTYALACATPFTALAAVAGAWLGRRDGVALMLIVWAVSQAVGFGLLGYPHDAHTLVQGASLALAALAALFAARRTVGVTARLPLLARMALGFLAASLAFKLVMLPSALGFGDIAAYAPPVLLRQLLRNAAIGLALLLVHDVLVRIGVPTGRPRRAAA